MINAIERGYSVNSILRDYSGYSGAFPLKKTVILNVSLKIVYFHKIYIPEANYILNQ